MSPDSGTEDLTQEEAAAAAALIQNPEPEPEAEPHPPAEPPHFDQAAYLRAIEERVDEPEAREIAAARDLAWVEGWIAARHDPESGFKASTAAVLVGMHRRNRNPPKPRAQPAPRMGDGARLRREREAEEARRAALSQEERERERAEADRLIQECLKQRLTGSGPRFAGSAAPPTEEPGAWLIEEGIGVDAAIRLGRRRPREWIEARLGELKAQGLRGKPLGRALLNADLDEEADAEVSS